MSVLGSPRACLATSASPCRSVNDGSTCMLHDHMPASSRCAYKRRIMTSQVRTRVRERPPISEPFDLALIEYYRDDCRWERYRRLVEIGAEIGDPLARYAIATWYLHGHAELKIERDPAKGAEHLEACASLFGRAAYDLAVSRLKGIGTRQARRVAFGLYVAASNLGSLAAMEAQALCLAQGIGTPADATAAKLLSRRVARWKKELKKADALPEAPRKRRSGPARRKTGERHLRSRR
jgi:TPR repeat protein